MNWKTILSSVRKLPVKRILLVILLLYIAALVVPYIPHKKVSETFQKHFQDVLSGADRNGAGGIYQ